MAIFHSVMMEHLAICKNSKSRQDFLFDWIFFPIDRTANVFSKNTHKYFPHNKKEVKFRKRLPL